MTNAMTSHSDAELLAAFVDGKLDPQQLQAVAAHLASCEECRGVIGEAVAFENAEVAVARAPRGARIAAVAAAVLIAALAFPGYRLYRQREIEKSSQSLFAAEAQTERSIAGRFSGQMIYAKHRTMRGSEDAVPSEIQVAAADVLDAAGDDESVRAIRARAVAESALKLRTAAQALADLQKIPDGRRDAKAWNDIAALSLATNDKASVLHFAGHALQRQPKMPEALFNRALS